MPAMMTWRRDSLSQTVEGVPHTFSSWNNCMSKAYCKFVLVNLTLLSAPKTPVNILTQVACHSRHHHRLPPRHLHCLVSRPLPLLRHVLLLFLFLLLRLLLSVPLPPLEQQPRQFQQIRRPPTVDVPPRALSRLPARSTPTQLRAPAIRPLRRWQEGESQ